VAAWLTAHGYATPRKLVLIATPYRFIGEDGMSRQDFNAFAARYQADPESTMRSFQALMRMGDRVQEGNPLPLGEGRVRENINADADNALTPALSQRERETPSPWLPWLDVLRNCDAATLPPLPVAPLVIHGAGDRVVPVAQAMRWETPHRLILPHTGHAPHLHDPTACAQAITEYLG
jgi:pimeloyl-ACP methyl ester carboxylesterase